MRYDKQNEYGAALDKNGYAPSIVQSDTSICYNCKRGGDVARHELFHDDMSGRLRDKSKRYGLWVGLCPVCHGYYHTYSQIYKPTQKIAQQRAMDLYGWSIGGFRKEFGKSYI